ncbi:reverse transcriptase [Trichonephila clavipes]|nr:reverse transcriptase [Trichonephila clavipes]
MIVDSEVLMKRVPSHVGIPGNEIADQKDKQGAESTPPEVLLTLRRAKGIISTYIDKYTAMTQETKSFGKPWKTLTIVSPIPRHLERAEDITCFRLATGHDFLELYLHWLGVAANEACPLCGHARMDGDHLLQCTGLDEYPADNIVSQYSHPVQTGTPRYFLNAASSYDMADFNFHIMKIHRLGSRLNLQPWVQKARDKPPTPPSRRIPKYKFRIGRAHVLTSGEETGRQNYLRYYA